MAAEKTIRWIAAWEQRIIIVPQSDLVVAINAGLYASSAQDGVAIDILDNFVLAAIQDWAAAYRSLKYLGSVHRGRSQSSRRTSGYGARRGSCRYPD